jgi:hypothetical protein
MSEESLKPPEPVDSAQAWFWESSWQALEREADEDLAVGRTTRHGSSEAFLRALDRA